MKCKVDKVYLSELVGWKLIWERHIWDLSKYKVILIIIMFANTLRKCIDARGREAWINHWWLKAISTLGAGFLYSLALPPPSPLPGFGAPLKILRLCSSFTSISTALKATGGPEDWGLFPQGSAGLPGVTFLQLWGMDFSPSVCSPTGSRLS